MRAVRGAPPSSALRAPSPIEGEGDGTADFAVSPSPLMGEGGRSPDEGGAASAVPALDPAVKRARLRGFARDMRGNPTDAERRLWSVLRDRRFVGFKFRRQQPVGPFIADFVCYERHLVIELDGSQHGDDPTDAPRDAELARRGFRVLRIWNNDLIKNRIGVLEGIVAALAVGAPPLIRPSGTFPHRGGRR